MISTSQFDNGASLVIDPVGIYKDLGANIAYICDVVDRMAAKIKGIRNSDELQLRASISQAMKDFVDFFPHVADELRILLPRTAHGGGRGSGPGNDGD